MEATVVRRAYAGIVAVVLVAAAVVFMANGTTTNDPTYVVFTIDTERDVPPLLESYAGIEQGMPQLLSLFEEHEVSATFLVTGRIAQTYPDMVHMLAEGHEVGCHGMYHDVALSSLAYEEKAERIEQATTLITNVTGTTPTSFRAPGHSCDTDVIRILEGIGYTVEASCYQGESYPYHPSYDDWTKEGEMDMLRIPASNAPEYFYPFYYHDTDWRIPYEYVVDAQAQRDMKIVVIGLHPWELCTMELPEGYEAIEASCGEHTYQRLADLLDYLDDKDVEYITLAEAYGLITSSDAS